MTVRAFTHGYDLFYPHRVILWHEYTRNYRPKHWDDHTAEKGRGDRRGRRAIMKPSAATAYCSAWRTAMLISALTVSARSHAAGL